MSHLNGSRLHWPIPSTLVSGSRNADTLTPIESGNLQAMVLIQIVMHLLEKIEKLLGLPQEFRLNANGGDCHGLLNDEDFAKIIKIIIKKEETGNSENGKGGIKALRKLMKKSKHLLKESITP